MFIQFNNEAEWRAFRKGKIGGTTASALIGENPYKTNVDAYQIISGIKEEEDISNKPYVIKGKEAEELILKLWSLDHPEFDVIHFANAVYIDDKRPYLYCSPDGLAVNRETGEKWTLEIKTAEVLRTLSKEKWTKDNIPTNYLVQTLVETHCANETVGTILIAELKHSDDYTTRITRVVVKNDYLTTIDELLEVIDDFWNNNIQKKKEPNLIVKL